MKLKESEHDIENLLISYLWTQGYYTQRMNSGKLPIVDKYGKKRMVLMSPAGTPDIMCFKEKGDCVRLIFFEVKTPNNKTTWLQNEKMTELREFGAECYVVHSLEELKDCL